MAKILIDYTVYEETGADKHTIKTKGIINDKEIKFYDGDILVTLSIDNNKIEMIRTNTNYCLQLIFMNNLKTTGYYYLKDTNTQLDIDIYTKKINISDGQIKIDYRLTFENKGFQNYHFNLNYTLEK